jgi:hypothetical protein
MAGPAMPATGKWLVKKFQADHEAHKTRAFQRLRRMLRRGRILFIAPVTATSLFLRPQLH